MLPHFLHGEVFWASEGNRTCNFLCFSSFTALVHHPSTCINAWITSLAIRMFRFNSGQGIREKLSWARTLMVFASEMSSPYSQFLYYLNLLFIPESRRGSNWCCRWHCCLSWARHLCYVLCEETSRNSCRKVREGRCRSRLWKTEWKKSGWNARGQSERSRVTCGMWSLHWENASRLLLCQLVA